VGDPPETQHACREAAAVEEAEAKCGPTEESEQCCSGWPSSASGAGSTAPESKAAASGSWSPGCSDPGCSAPAGQNHAWCSPSDFRQKFFTSKDIAGINSGGYDNSLRKKTQP